MQGGLGYKLDFGIGVCFLYIFLMKFAITLTINSNVPAIISVWSPNAICLLLSVYLFKRLRRSNPYLSKHKDSQSKGCHVKIFLNQIQINTLILGQEEQKFLLLYQFKVRKYKAMNI